VINGEKWFASNFPYAAFVIAMVITNPDVPVPRGSSMLLIPAGTDGMEEIRITGLGAEPLGEGAHGYIRFRDCRVPADSLLGDEGGGFNLAQQRLGGGRLHHAMRAIGRLKRAFDMMCEFATSRSTQGAPLGKKQAVPQSIADSWIQIEQFRMQVLHAAWICDQGGYDAGRRYISAVKAALPAVVTDVVYRAMHLHGALGVSNEMPFVSLWLQGPVMATVDGGTEIHKDVLAPSSQRLPTIRGKLPVATPSRAGCRRKGPNSGQYSTASTRSARTKRLSTAVGHANQVHETGIPTLPRK